jgi:hypothetical protein
MIIRKSQLLRRTIIVRKQGPRGTRQKKCSEFRPTSTGSSDPARTLEQILNHFNDDVESATRYAIAQANLR